MKQSVTICGLGVSEFEAAVKGVMSIYQVMQSRVSGLKARLREWSPTRDRDDLALVLGNRYLTPIKEVDGDAEGDMDEIDPFKVLKPLLRNEVYTLDNVVQYWQRTLTSNR